MEATIPKARNSPSRRETYPPVTTRAKATAAITESRASRRKTDGAMGILVRSAATAATKLRLATLEPTTLPTPRARFPRLAAMADTSISGAGGPNPSTTAPITTGDIDSARANRAEPSTKWSAATTRIAIPPRQATRSATTWQPSLCGQSRRQYPWVHCYRGRSCVVGSSSDRYKDCSVPTKPWLMSSSCGPGTGG